mmetsp:Transcript_22494/g.53306  ORF Transcript_22494/g.53306 Transcript_22494/m.53306 type:complete len:432 (+) Transcript_22494:332-1627(+)
MRPFIFLTAQGMRHSARYTSAKDPEPSSDPSVSSLNLIRTASMLSIADTSFPSASSSAVPPPPPADTVELAEAPLAAATASALSLSLSSLSWWRSWAWSLLSSCSFRCTARSFSCCSCSRFLSVSACFRRLSRSAWMAARCLASCSSWSRREFWCWVSCCCLPLTPFSRSVSCAAAWCSCSSRVSTCMWCRRNRSSCACNCRFSASESPSLSGTGGRLGASVSAEGEAPPAGEVEDGSWECTLLWRGGPAEGAAEGLFSTMRWPTISPSSSWMVAGRISTSDPSTISSCCPLLISTTCPSSISTTLPFGISTTRPLGLLSLKSFPSGSSTTSPLPSVPGDDGGYCVLFVFSIPRPAFAPRRGVSLELGFVSSSKCASAHSIACGTPARFVARHARRACAGLNPTSARACVRKSRLFSFPAALLLILTVFQP